jgi:hypothetical protein
MMKTVSTQVGFRLRFDRKASEILEEILCNRRA